MCHTCYISTRVIEQPMSAARLLKRTPAITTKPNLYRPLKSPHNKCIVSSSADMARRISHFFTKRVCTEENPEGRWSSADIIWLLMAVQEFSECTPRFQLFLAFSTLSAKRAWVPPLPHFEPGKKQCFLPSSIPCHLQPNLLVGTGLCLHWGESRCVFQCAG